MSRKKFYLWLGVVAFLFLEILACVMFYQNRMEAAALFMIAGYLHRINERMSGTADEPLFK